MPKAERYLVAPAQAGDASQPGLLDEVAKIIAATPNATLVHGASQRRSHLVVEMEPDTARKLQDQFGSGLIIESDAPLRY